jgi:malonate transporter and related proteins
MVGMSRDQVLSQVPLGFAIVLGMAGGYAIVLSVSRYLLRRDLMTASLEALTISGPAVPFIGVSVLGHLFGNASAIPISVASLVMNLIQVPATLLLLSAGTAQADKSSTARQPSLRQHIIHALRQPVVWAPLLALVLILFNLHFPASIRESLLLLGSATGGVALFASGIVLFSFRAAFNLTVGVSLIARNVAIPAVIWGSMLFSAWRRRSLGKRCSRWLSRQPRSPSSLPSNITWGRRRWPQFFSSARSSRSSPWAASSG